MTLDYEPLLRVQRDLFDVPPGRERFERYLDRVRGPDRAATERPPLVAVNPMAKGHVAARLDELLALGADDIAARAAAEASAVLRDEPGDFRVGVVVVDDVGGGWTNRAADEYGLRFNAVPGADGRLPRWLKEPWLTAVVWASEPPTGRAVREAVLTAAHRAAHVRRRGLARTLRDKLAQEGRVLLAAGCDGPTLDADDLEYTRGVVAEFLGADDMRTAVECLFGDALAGTLGFTPRGLSPWAGLALALADARACS